MRKLSMHWALHPEKDAEWYNAQKKRRTEDWIARELDINYSLSVSGRVFSAFRAERHITNERPEFNPHRPLYRVWDFGKVNCVLYIQRDQYSRTTVLHERVLGSPDQPSSTTEQIRVALMDSEELFEDAHFIDICDPAGSFEDHRGESTDVDELVKNNILPHYRMILELPTKERKKRGRDRISRDLQQTPNGKEAFQIYVSDDGTQGAVCLKEAFLGGYCYRKDPNGNTTDKIMERHPYEDVIDCLIYYYLENGTDDGGDDGKVPPIVYGDGPINPYTG